jgi:hypothetical protein
MKSPNTKLFKKKYGLWRVERKIYKIPHNKKFPKKFQNFKILKYQILKISTFKNLQISNISKISKNLSYLFCPGKDEEHNPSVGRGRIFNYGNHERSKIRILAHKIGMF